MLRFTAPPMPHIIVAGEDTYEVGGTHPDRSGIGVFDLIAVTRGALYLEEDGEACDVTAGRYIILRPDLSHRTRLPCAETTHFYWIHFQTLGGWSETEERLAAAPDTATAVGPYATIESFAFYLPGRGSWEDAPGLPDLARQLLALQAMPSAASRWKHQQLFHELLSQLQLGEREAADSPHYAVAERAAAYLKSRYKENIDYRRLSEALHFHANYISLCMKKTFGCTPLEYLTRHRIEQAKFLLIHTDSRIGRIAEEVGFGTFPHFVRCFVRQTGTTPRAFRGQYRRGAR